MGKDRKQLKSVRHYDLLGDALDDEASREEQANHIGSRQLVFKNGNIRLSGRPFIGDGDDADSE